MIPTLGLLAAGFGIAFGLVMILLVIVDIGFIRAGRPTISRRAVDAATRYPAIAAAVSGVLALLLGMLLGHLFMGQPVATACSCAPGATCKRQCPEPCRCRPVAAGYRDAEYISLLHYDVSCSTQPVPDAKPILLGFKQKLCPACIRMERDLKKRPDVQAAIKAKFDVRLYDWQTDRDMFEKYAVRDLPTCILLDATGKELRRAVGYKSPNELLRWLGLDAPR